MLFASSFSDFASNFEPRRKTPSSSEIRRRISAQHADDIEDSTVSIEKRPSESVKDVPVRKTSLPLKPAELEARAPSSLQTIIEKHSPSLLNGMPVDDDAPLRITRRHSRPDCLTPPSSQRLSQGKRALDLKAKNVPHNNSSVLNVNPHKLGDDAEFTGQGPENLISVSQSKKGSDQPIHTKLAVEETSNLLMASKTVPKAVVEEASLPLIDDEDSLALCFNGSLGSPIRTEDPAAEGAATPSSPSLRRAVPSSMRSSPSLRIASSKSVAVTTGGPSSQTLRRPPPPLPTPYHTSSHHSSSHHSSSHHLSPHRHASPPRPSPHSLSSHHLPSPRRLSPRTFSIRSPTSPQNLQEKAVTLHEISLDLDSTSLVNGAAFLPIQLPEHKGQPTSPSSPVLFAPKEALMDASLSQKCLAELTDQDLNLSVSMFLAKMEVEAVPTVNDESLDAQGRLLDGKEPRARSDSEKSIELFHEPCLLLPHKATDAAKESSTLKDQQQGDSTLKDQQQGDSAMREIAPVDLVLKDKGRHSTASPALRPRSKPSPCLTYPLDTRLNAGPKVVTQPTQLLEHSDQVRDRDRGGIERPRIRRMLPSSSSQQHGDAHLSQPSHLSPYLSHPSKVDSCTAPSSLRSHILVDPVWQPDSISSGHPVTTVDDPAPALVPALAPAPTEAPTDDDSQTLFVDSFWDLQRKVSKSKIRINKSHRLRRLQCFQTHEDITHVRVLSGSLIAVIGRQHIFAWRLGEDEMSWELAGQQKLPFSSPVSSVHAVHVDILLVITLDQPWCIAMDKLNWLRGCELTLKPGFHITCACGCETGQVYLGVSNVQSATVMPIGLSLLQQLGDLRQGPSDFEARDSSYALSSIDMVLGRDVVLICGVTRVRLFIWSSEGPLQHVVPLAPLLPSIDSSIENLTALQWDCCNVDDSFYITGVLHLSQVSDHHVGLLRVRLIMDSVVTADSDVELELLSNLPHAHYVYGLGTYVVLGTNESVDVFALCTSVRVARLALSGPIAACHHQNLLFALATNARVVYPFHLASS